MAKSPESLVRTIKGLERPGAFTGSPEPKQRAIRVDQACVVCSQLQSQSLSLLRDLAAIIRGGAGGSGESTDKVAFIPGGAALPQALETLVGSSESGRILRIPNTFSPAVLRLGGVVLGGSVGIDVILRGIAREETATLIEQTVGVIIDQSLNRRKRGDECVKFMMSRAFQQKPQSRGYFVSVDPTTGLKRVFRPRR